MKINSRKNIILIEETGEDWFKRGIKEYNNGNHINTLPYFLEAAEVYNHDAAQYYLGVMYEHGEGEDLPRDLNQALMWYNTASRNGNMDAQYNISCMYSVGKVYNRIVNGLYKNV